MNKVEKEICNLCEFYTCEQFNDPKRGGVIRFFQPKKAYGISGETKVSIKGCCQGEWIVK